MLHIRNVLDQSAVAAMRKKLLAAQWVDGRATAGHMSSAAKKNRQLGEDDATGLALGAEILDALSKNAVFASAALPAKISPPLFNRYEGGETYGDHIDGALRPLGKGRMRCDLSATLFLSNPDDYEGGELVVVSGKGEDRIKLSAGDLILYEASSIHRVEPVTKGARLAGFFWIESAVRDSAQRQILFDLDSAIQMLNANDNAKLKLTAVYHNLLRQWAGS